MTKKGRVFSGARPTGRQHLGNYLGAIKNYVALQDEYDCVYCIVDVHALSTVETTAELKQNTYEMALDWLSAGIRPQDSIMFVQSHAPQVMELHTYLSMVSPMGKLTDLPTFKEKVRMFTLADLEGLMTAAGLQVRQRLGSYALKPFDPGDELRVEDASDGSHLSGETVFFEDCPRGPRPPQACWPGWAGGAP